MIKRNLKLYIKEKSTIIALFFELVFIIVFLCSFIPSFNVIRGIRNELKREDISFMSSNGVDTTYLVTTSNHLFYSQYKNDADSHLNKYANIHNLGNEYADPTAHLYNFIYLDYEFNSRIIDVKGLSDATSSLGYTCVLTKDGKLYILARDDSSFTIIANNVKSFTNSFKNIMYLDNNDKLYMINLNFKTIDRYALPINNANNYFIVSNDEFYYQQNNKLYNGKITSSSLLNSSSSSYLINEYEATVETKLTSISNVTHVATNGSATMLVADNKIYGIDKKEPTFKEDFELFVNPGHVDELYISGQFAFLFKIDGNFYYRGNIKIFDNEEDELKKYDVDADAIYFSRNGSMYLKNDRLYLYNKDTLKYEAMYENYLVSYVLKYLSLFVCVMIFIYLLIAFLEANERYNRYFKSEEKKNG